VLTHYLLHLEHYTKAVNKNTLRTEAGLSPTNKTSKRAFVTSKRLKTSRNQQDQAPLYQHIIFISCVIGFELIVHHCQALLSRPYHLGPQSQDINAVIVVIVVVAILFAIMGIMGRWGALLWPLACVWAQTLCITQRVESLLGIFNTRWHTSNYGGMASGSSQRFFKHLFIWIMDDMTKLNTAKMNYFLPFFFTWVSRLCRKGAWCLPNSFARITSFRASKLWLICRPSIWVCLSVASLSAPLSDPAKSIKENFPSTSDVSVLTSRRRSAAWLRLDVALAPVALVARADRPWLLACTKSFKSTQP